MFLFFFFNDTATTEIYTLSLHDALPICRSGHGFGWEIDSDLFSFGIDPAEIVAAALDVRRSEEHTSELQSRPHLVCRLLLEKKKKHSHRDMGRNTSETAARLLHRESVTA